MINLGFIGLGNMGLQQTRAFAKVRGCRIAAGADPSAAAGQRFADLYPDAAVHTDYRAMLRAGGLDAVVVAVPTRHHPRPAIDALKRGLPVLLEKPMARTVADCRRIIHAAEQADTLLMIAHCRRFDAHWGYFGELIRKERIGRPVLWRSLKAGVNGGWFVDDKLGGGPLFDATIHNYDFAHTLFGRAVSVMGRGIKLSDASAIATGSALIEYEQGDQLLASWSWDVRGLGSDDVLGPNGSLIFGTAGLEPTDDDPSAYVYFCHANGTGERKLLKRKVDRGRMYVNQARHFLACVRGEATCEAPGEVGLEAVAVAEAVLKAMTTGRRQTLNKA